MLACGGTNADHLLLWIHNSCKDALLIQLKKKKEQSTKMQRFFLTSVQQDILCRSPGSIDCDTLLKALKHKCRYVMLEVFGDKAPLGEYMKRMQRLEDIQVRLISSHLCVRDPPQSLAPPDHNSATKTHRFVALCVCITYDRFYAKQIVIQSGTIS